ncbi:hypothetical protein CRG98_039053 [Punica granatum]|uniref:Uncharacterized protein n=1 Tax=Punica granatum TaxID=22663 RepID=A0A2I0I983_PUNGR|nr:hypothetical protein CRG98_039053 [Punica granatum]
MNLARVSRPGKVARGTSEVARRTCGAGKKVRSHGLADPARLQEARARWLGELAMQESKLERISRPGKFARGTNEIRQVCKKHGRGGSATLRGRKVKSQGLADSARLQEARARWLGEPAGKESKLARVSRPGKDARGTSEVARRTCDARKKVSSHGIENLARLQEARARWLGELAVQEMKLARTRQVCKRHERGGSKNLRCKTVNSHGLADPARLQVARGRWLGELAAQEIKLARVSRSGKVGETGQGCKGHERGGSANLRFEKVNSHGLADPARLQEARAWWFGELAVQESKHARVSRPGKFARGTNETRQDCKWHEGGGSANLRHRKVSSHGLANLARLLEARARWLGDLAVQESKLARVSRPDKVARGRSEVARRTCGTGKKVNSHGLADPTRLQGAGVRWLGELAAQESKLARVSEPRKAIRGTSEVARRSCGAGKKVSSHGLANLARLLEARARWLGDLAVQESKLARVSRPDKVARGRSEVARRTCGTGKKVNSHGLADPTRLQGAGVRWLGELAAQESKLARVSEPRKAIRGTSEVARRSCGAGKKVSSHGLANLARLLEARARWLGDLAVQESKLARVSRPDKVARGRSEVARRTCGTGKKVNSHGLADPTRLQGAGVRWLGELAAQEINSHGLADPTRLQGAGVRWLGELAAQESKLARVSEPRKAIRGTSEVARRSCGAGKKVSSHGLANLARLLEARARWLGDLAVQESKLARVSRPDKVARGRSEVARRTCGTGKKVNSHGLADPTRLQGAGVRWLGELAAQESKLARVSEPRKAIRGTSEVARRSCGAGKKVSSHGLANLARLLEARARWLGDLAVQESKLARVSRPDKVARGRSEVARRTCGTGKKVNSHGLADPTRLQGAGVRWLGELAAQESKLARVSEPRKAIRGTSEVARRSCGAGKKVSSHGLANLARLLEARARWLGELAAQEIKLARVSRSGKVARRTVEVARRTCATRQDCKRHEGGGSANLRRRKLSSHGLADPARLQEARARWLGELAAQEIKLARVSRPGKVARSTSEVARRTCGAGN